MWADLECIPPSLAQQRTTLFVIAQPDSLFPALFHLTGDRHRWADGYHDVACVTEYPAYGQICSRGEKEKRKEKERKKKEKKEKRKEENVLSSAVCKTEHLFVVMLA